MKPTSRAPLSITSLQVIRHASFDLQVKALNVKRQRIVCVAGANGSGKTTLIEAIVGLLPIDDLAVHVLGKPANTSRPDIKKNLGFVPDDDTWIIPELTAREYFHMLSSIYRANDVKHDLEANVSSIARRLMFTTFDQPLGSLSHGNRKKVQLIAGLMHQPALIVLDELRNGLDPIAIKQAEELIRDYSQAGAAVIAATHDLWWAERFADQIVMLHHGRVILHDDTPNIIAEAGSVEAKFIELYQASYA